MTSHDLEDIDSVCDRVIILKKGVVVYNGALSNIGDRRKYKLISFNLEQDLPSLDMAVNIQRIDNRYEIQCLQEDYISLLEQLKNISNIKISDLPLSYVLERLDENDS